MIRLSWYWPVGLFVFGSVMTDTTVGVRIYCDLSIMAQREGVPVDLKIYPSGLTFFSDIFFSSPYSTIYFTHFLRHLYYEINETKIYWIPFLSPFWYRPFTINKNIRVRFNYQAITTLLIVHNEAGLYWNFSPFQPKPRAAYSNPLHKGCHKTGQLNYNDAILSSCADFPMVVANINKLHVTYRLPLSKLYW